MGSPLDVLVREVDNGSSPEFTSEEDMAKTDDIQKSVARLEKTFWAVLLVLLGWLGTLSTMIYGLHGDLQAIKQKIADGGNGAIVSALQHPTSPQQLAANLGLVSSQVRVARIAGTKPDPKKVMSLSEAA